MRTTSCVHVVILTSAMAGAVWAGTGPQDAIRLEEARGKGLGGAVVAYVESTEKNVCDPRAEQPGFYIEKVFATPLARGGIADHQDVDDTGKEIPRTYWEDYSAYFLVVHDCYHGSTQGGSWVEPKGASLWRVSYREQVKPGARAKSPRLKIERVQDVSLPRMD
jgi:hypothetical protein